jgi:hypothetical protein
MHAAIFRHTAAAFISVTSLFTTALAQPIPQLSEAEKQAKKPIAVGGGQVGDLLRQWWKEGAAAGNVGDWYDNRDGSHSDLDLGPFPQVQRFIYTPEDIKLRRHWAVQPLTRPFVTFGNSSTSAPPLQGGSNPRHYYTSTRGLEILFNHYTHNNVYIYPEHRDHDPGHNGRGDGYGDLYPTNTPYLIISQGSSGSDQPFMRALPYTLAAFRPEVKKKLVESGLLMPTIQMIFRSSNNHLKDPGEYLTGKAHPTVFEGGWVDPLKMIRLAHAIEPGNIPPVVRLKVLEEDLSVPGKDFFDKPASEKLADTPGCIARVFRGRERLRRLVVTAEDSLDLSNRPFTFRWVVLRGQADKITIRPRNKAGSVAELIIPYHPRLPVAPNSALASNRVDIGVFAHNGAYHSAPAFITFFSLDSEARTYGEDGRILEIGYDNGEVNLNIADWVRLLEIAAGDSPAGRLLTLSAAERRTVAEARKPFQALTAALAAAQQQHKDAEASAAKAHAAWKAASEKLLLLALKEDFEQKSEQTQRARLLAQAKEVLTSEAKKLAEAEVQKTRKALEAASRARDDFLTKKTDSGQQSLRELLEGRLWRLLDNPDFGDDHHEILSELLRKAGPGREGSIKAARRRLTTFGLARQAKGMALELRPLRGDKAPLTAYEKLLLQRYRAALLTELLYPGVVTSTFQPNFVDQRLTVPKLWRDVYYHDAQGKVLGWTRYDGDKQLDFTADGFLVMDKDALGRCKRARTVRYFADPKEKVGYNQTPLRFAPGEEIVTYEYNGDGDRRGQIKSRVPVEP